MKMKEAVHDKMVVNKQECSEGISGQMKMCIPKKMSNDNEGKAKTRLYISLPIHYFVTEFKLPMGNVCLLSIRQRLFKLWLEYRLG